MRSNHVQKTRKVYIFLLAIVLFLCVFSTFAFFCAILFERKWKLKKKKGERNGGKEEFLKEENEKRFFFSLLLFWKTESECRACRQGPLSRLMGKNKIFNSLFTSKERKRKREKNEKEKKRKKGPRN